MSRFIPAYRLPDKALVDEVMTMCIETGVEIYRRQEELAAGASTAGPTCRGSFAPPSWSAAATMRRRRSFLSEEIAAAIKGSELIVIEQCGH